MQTMELCLTILLLYVSCGIVSSQRTIAHAAEQKEAIIEYTLNVLQSINERLLSIEIRQQSIEERLASTESQNMSAENRQQLNQSRLQSTEMLFNGQPPPPSNAIPRNYTQEQCRSGRLLEEAVVVIMNKTKRRDIEQPTNADIAEQETGGHKTVQRSGLVDILLEHILDGYSSSSKKMAFGEGDRVRVDMNETKATQLQIGYGGWTNGMKEHLGTVGVVKKMAAQVLFSNGAEYWYNPELLSKTTDVAEDGLSRYKGYDVVVIDTNQTRAEKLQVGHGGWYPKMSAVLGKKGFVRKVDSDGDVYVEFINETKWLFHPKLLKIVNTTNLTIQNGDFVFIINSYEKFKALQDSDHGGWHEKMRDIVGEGGVVTQVSSNGRIRVKVGSVTWICNKLALTLVAKSSELT